jgi:50S ribosomal protein L16 3-hydroxylase
LRQLSASFGRSLPGDQRIIVFATPANSHGFGWHYDVEDVFVLQTAGDKEYLMRSNTVSPPLVRGAPLHFEQYERESSPMLSCRMLAGDMLYIPRGYWHVGYAREHSLSISIGVFPEPHENRELHRTLTPEALR